MDKAQLEAAISKAERELYTLLAEEFPFYKDGSGKVEIGSIHMELFESMLYELARVKHFENIEVIKLDAIFREYYRDTIKQARAARNYQIFEPARHARDLFQDQDYVALAEYLNEAELPNLSKLAVEVDRRKKNIIYVGYTLTLGSIITAATYDIISRRAEKEGIADYEYFKSRSSKAFRKIIRDDITVLGALQQFTNFCEQMVFYIGAIDIGNEQLNEVVRNNLRNTVEVFGEKIISAGIPDKARELDNLFDQQKELGKRTKKAKRSSLPLERRLVSMEKVLYEKIISGLHGDSVEGSKDSGLDLTMQEFTSSLDRLGRLLEFYENEWQAGLKERVNAFGKLYKGFGKDPDTTFGILKFMTEDNFSVVLGHLLQLPPGKERDQALETFSKYNGINQSIKNLRHAFEIGYEWKVAFNDFIIGHNEDRLIRGYAEFKVKNPAGFNTNIGAGAPSALSVIASFSDDKDFAANYLGEITYPQMCRQVAETEFYENMKAFAEKVITAGIVEAAKELNELQQQKQKSAIQR